MTATSRRVFTIIGAVLFLLGGLVGYASLVWSITSTYSVEIGAPGDVSWTLWIPRPVTEMELQLDGPGVTVSPIASIHGILDNVSGRGRASLHYVLRHTMYGGDPLEGSWTVDLTGREGPSDVWVWRASSDPPATIALSGRSGWQGGRLFEDVQCGGYGYLGNPAEGWAVVPGGLGDCTNMIPFPSPFVFSVALLAAGAIVATVPLWRKTSPAQTQ